MNTNFGEFYELHEFSFLLNDKKEIRVIRKIR
jgi:hypothetical protein